MLLCVHGLAVVQLTYDVAKLPGSGRRRFAGDHSTWHLAFTADQVDTWDHNGKLWKLQFIPRGPTTAIPPDLNGKSSFVMPSGGELGIIYDIQSIHAGVAWPGSPPALLSKAPKELHDISIYGLPSGLN